MKTTDFPLGAPCWADLSTPDAQGSRAFYGALFGWEGEAGPPETHGYVTFSLGGEPVVGAMNTEGPDQPVGWGVYFRSDDLEATTRAVETAGGKTVYPPMDVLDVGRMAIYTAPDGALFCAWQPGAHKGSGVMGESGSLCWFELNTTDTEGAESFYGQVFGWTATPFPFGPPGGYTTLKAAAAEDQFGGIMPRTDDYPAEIGPGWLPYFAVDDVDATAAKATELGGGVVTGPESIEHVGRIACLKDAHGAVFNVLKPEM